MSTEGRPVVTYGTLFGVLACLLALTGATVAASRVDVAGANIWITLLIAAAKASLVLLFFMHLKHEKRVFMYTLLATVLLAAMFIGFLFWDVAYRTAP